MPFRLSRLGHKRKAHHSVKARIPDDIYDPAQQRAEREGTTVTAVVQECLRRYGQEEEVDDVGNSRAAVAAGAHHSGSSRDAGYDPEGQALWCPGRHPWRYGQEEE